MTTAPSSESLQYSDRYAAISRRFLRQAQAEPDAGDTIQASEKAWSAAAHAIKAVAEKWGRCHQGHYRIEASLDYIVYERGREDLPRIQAKRLRLLSTRPRDYKARPDGISLLPPVEPEPPEFL